MRKGPVTVLLAALAMTACDRKPAPPAGGGSPSPEASDDSEARDTFDRARSAISGGNGGKLWQLMSKRMRDDFAAGLARELERCRNDAARTEEFKKVFKTLRDPKDITVDEYGSMALSLALAEPPRRANFEEQIGTKFVGSRRRGKVLVIEADAPSGKRTTTGWIREDGDWKYDREASVDARARVVLRLPAGGDGVLNIAWSPDGKRIAGCGVEGVVRVWDAVEGGEPRQIGKLDMFPKALGWADDSTVAAITLMDGLFLYPTAGGEPKKLDVGTVIAADFGVRCGRAALLRFHNKVDIHNFATGAIESTLDLPVDSQEFLALSADGAALATAAGNQVTLWDVKAGKKTRDLAIDADILYLAFSGDGKWLAANDRNSTLRIWDCATGTEAGSWATGNTLIGSGFAPLSGGPRLAWGGADKVSFADAATKRQRDAPLDLWISSLAASPDGTRVAAGHQRDGITILEAGSE